MSLYIFCPQKWSQGVYFLHESFRTAIVAINDYPVSNVTLMCRILGWGIQQKQEKSPRIYHKIRSFIEMLRKFDFQKLAESTY
ncbi:MAG: hypothetical protein PUP93_23815 [Rhizonema sp. NSF051]|nr:hypothetical protein [Rhizonema sp. NSF051]